MEIHSKHLVLRPIKLVDAAAVFRYRSDEKINRYQGWIPKSLEEVYDFVENKVSNTINVVDTWFQLVLILKESNELIGDIGMHFLDLENLQVEIGCTLALDHQGKGYASEALHETINFLFGVLEKHRISASVDPRNHKSIRLVEALGFRKEAHFKESLFIKGQWYDDVIYAVLRKEWLAANQSS